MSEAKTRIYSTPMSEADFEVLRGYEKWSNIPRQYVLEAMVKILLITSPELTKTLTENAQLLHKQALTDKMSNGGSFNPTEILSEFAKPKPIKPDNTSKDTPSTNTTNKPPSGK